MLPEASQRRLDRRDGPLCETISSPLPRLCKLLRLSQLNRHQLAYAFLRHRHSEQAVHAGHGDRVVGDGDKAGVGALAHGLEQVAEALNVIIVERSVDFVQHTDRRRVGEEHGEDERKSGQRLLAA